MNALSIRTRRRKFHFVKFDSLVRVETRGGKVLVKTSRNNFSERQKAFFIRHLAAEGFIPDEYQAFSEKSSSHFPNLRWAVDTSWMQGVASFREQAIRQALCAVAIGGVIWLISLLPVFVRLWN